VSYTDAAWAVPPGIALLGWIAFHFSQRTFRAVVLISAAAVIVPVAAWLAFHHGLHGRLWTLSNHATAVEAGWAGLLIVAFGVLAGFDRLSARREQPRVAIPPAPDQKAGDDPGLRHRRLLTESLRFCLPAVDVRRPAAMPGGTTTDSLASLAEASGVQGSGIAAALMRVGQSLQGQPRTYEVRMFAERPRGIGGRLSVTVEMHDARTGHNVGVRVLQPCVQDEAAEKVAGYTARQVFRNDPSTPDWAVGSLDGEDLSAYLLARKICPAGRTYSAWWDCRKKRRAQLEEAARNSTGVLGVVGYELAGMYDLDGEYLRSLLLHLRNRVGCRQFWRGRNRLAISLGMLGGLDPDEFERQWLGAGGPLSNEEHARLKEAVIRELSLAGMLRHHPDREKALRGSDNKAARLALLRLARREFRAYWWRRHASFLLWTAFWYRRVRSESLTALSGRPWWWRHPRRRLWPVEFGLEIVKQRIRQLDSLSEADKVSADDELVKAQERVWRKLGLGEESGKAPDGARQPRWDFRRAPWQAVYNAACLHAIRTSSRKLVPGADRYATELLRLAISYPDCELDRPSEWIATDPDLRPLRKPQPENGPYENFVTEQAAMDFEPSQFNNVGDPWFRDILGRAAAGTSARPKGRQLSAPETPLTTSPAQPGRARDFDPAEHDHAAARPKATPCSMSADAHRDSRPTHSGK